MSTHAIVGVGNPGSFTQPDTQEDRCMKFVLERLFEWLLELKCPSTKLFYGRCKLYYYDQIQGIMGLKGFLASDFVVRIVKYTVVQRYMYNHMYWTTILKPKMLHWYMDTFVPRLVWKQMGKLEYGETEPILRITAPTNSKTTKATCSLGFNMGDLGDDTIFITPEAQTVLTATPKAYASSTSLGKRKFNSNYKGASKKPTPNHKSSDAPAQQQQTRKVKNLDFNF